MKHASSQHLRLKKYLYVTSFCFFCYIVFVIVFIAFQNWYLSPPSEMKSINDASAFFSAETEVIAIKYGTDTYYVIFGKWLFPNEQDAAYLFSSEGVFIGWSPESTHNSKLGNYWEKARRDPINKTELGKFKAP